MSTLDSSPSKESVISSTEGDSIDESRTLFIGDLQPSSPNSARLIRELFPDGKVLHIDVKVIESSKGPLCYAFVTFANSEAAQSALEKFDKGTVTLSDCTICRIGWARRNSRLHVSNLDESITEGALAALFSPFGDLNPEDGILIMRKPASCASNPQVVTYGVIHFEQRDCAESAKNALNGTFYDGRKLRVEWNRASRKSNMTRMTVVENENGTELIEIRSEASSPRRSPGSTPSKPKRSTNGTSPHPHPLVPTLALLSTPQQQGGGQQQQQQQQQASVISTAASGSGSVSVSSNPQSNADTSSAATNGSNGSFHFPMSMTMAPVISIYVQFETVDAESKVTEALITEVFQRFGHMTGCFIKTNNTSVSGLRQHGYAFVHFENTPDGKKSALAAAALSKEAPFQHNGVLFHAEVSKNFRRATSLYGNGKFHSFGSRHYGNNHHGPKHANHSYNYHQNQANYAGVPPHPQAMEDPNAAAAMVGHFIDADGVAYPYPPSHYPAYYYPNSGYPSPYGAYNNPSYGPYNTYGSYPSSGVTTPASSAPGTARSQLDRPTAAETGGFPIVFPPYQAYEQPNSARKPSVGDMSSAQFTPIEAASGAAAAAAGANGGMPAMGPYMYPQPYYGMAPVPYGSVGPIMYPGTPYPPPASPFNQNGLASSMAPSYMQPSVYAQAGDGTSAAAGTAVASVGADGSVVYNAAIPGQQPQQVYAAYNYNTTSGGGPGPIPMPGNAQAFNPSGSPPNASNSLSTAGAGNALPSGTSGGSGSKNVAPLSSAPRQVSDPTATPTVAQSQAYPQSRQSFVSPHYGYGTTMSSGSASDSNTSAPSGGANSSSGPLSAQGFDASAAGANPASTGYYAAGMQHVNYGQWPQN